MEELVEVYAELSNHNPPDIHLNYDQPESSSGFTLLMMLFREISQLGHGVVWCRSATLSPAVVK